MCGTSASVECKIAGLRFPAFRLFYTSNNGTAAMPDIARWRPALILSIAGRLLVFAHQSRKELK